MKNILIICLCLLSTSNGLAQLTWNRTVSKSWEDRWSRDHYDDINKETTLRLLETGANIFFVKELNKVIAHQHDELKDFNYKFSILKGSIINFVKGSSFNAGTGYNSYGYIKKKYPVINPINPGDVFRNKIIRTRFFNKLNKESNLINDYLSKDNPIPEGERILLVLNALENVIKITLENETY